LPRHSASAQIPPDPPIARQMRQPLFPKLVQRVIPVGVDQLRYGGLASACALAGTQHVHRAREAHQAVHIPASAIAADLADDVEGSRRSVALALSRLADGVQLLVERVLDHHESLQMKARAGV